MRIMMAGDTHGNLRHWAYLLSQAVSHNVEKILQLGDFGYWEHKKDGVHYLAALETMIAEVGIPVYWVDGNHENHEMLREKYIDPTRKDWAENSPYTSNEYPFIKIREGLWHIPRGTVWTWDDVKFLGIGGAYSVDRGYRRVGESFWFEEVLTDREAEDASKVGKVDVMVSHDVPLGLNMSHIFAKRGTNYSHIPASEYNRKLLRQVVEGCKPDYVFHGHYHVRYDDKLKLDSGHTIKVYGLSCDDSGMDSFSLVDLKRGKLDNPAEY